MMRPGVLVIILSALVGGCGDTEQLIITGPSESPFLDVDSRWTGDFPPFAGEHLRAVHLAPDGRAWIVGTGGLVLHFDGAVWERENAPVEVTLAAVTGLADGSVLAVGAEGVIIRRQGDAWVREPSPSRAPLTAVAAGKNDRAWAIGREGTILARQDGVWTALSPPTEQRLTCAAAEGDTLIVGGQAGSLFLRVGEAWVDLSGFSGAVVRDIEPAPPSLGGFFVSADSTYWYRGGTWQTIADRSPDQLTLAGHDLFLETSQRLDLQSDPPASSYTGWVSHVMDISGADRDEVLVVTSDDEIVWFDGDQQYWRPDPAGRMDMADLHVFANGEVICRDLGRFWIRNSLRWQILTERPVTNWSSHVPIVGASTQDFTYAIRDYIEPGGWHLNHFDGQTWSDSIGPFAIESPDRLALESDGTLWALSDFRIYSYDGSDWSEPAELAALEGGKWLFETHAGDILAASLADSNRALHHLEGATWSEVPEFRDRWLNTTYEAAGSFPEAFYLLGYWDFIAFGRAAGDTVLVEQDYDFGADIPSQVMCQVDTSWGIFVATSYPSHVLRLRGSPGQNSWQLIAGPASHVITSLAVSPDGLLFALMDGTIQMIDLETWGTIRGLYQ